MTLFLVKKFLLGCKGKRKLITGKVFYLVFGRGSGGSNLGWTIVENIINSSFLNLEKRPIS
jgi:hypothetical protein